MKRLVSLTLLAGLSLVACKVPSAVDLPGLSCALSFDNSSCDGSSNKPSQVTLTSVSVSPSVVRAGGEFTASASATFANCSGLGGGYSVGYANQMYPAATSASNFALTLTAVLGDTAVSFQAYCGSVRTAVESVTIQVLPPQ